MAFVFSTSHLPETRVRRPDHDADNDDNDDDGIMPPPPRSGGVRAFSHLPPRDCDDGAALSHAGPHCHGGGRDPEGMAKIIIDDASPLFAQRVRRALRAEAGESPAAAALLRHVGTLPNRICVKRRTGGLACTRTDADGNVTIHLNPHEMTSATFAHELGHVVQQAHTHGALQRIRATGRTPTNADLEDAIDAARDALDAIVRVKDERDADTEHKENEAMRISNIVNAERTATAMQGLPGALRTEEEFWARQRPRQSRDRHQDNARPLPPGSHYGTHPLGHVRRVLHRRS